MYSPYEINLLVEENQRLKEEVKQLHKDWQFDQKRLLEIKENKKELEFKIKCVEDKYKDLQADYEEYKNKNEYCEACQI